MHIVHRIMRFAFRSFILKEEEEVVFNSSNQILGTENEDGGYVVSIGIIEVR